MPHDDIKYTSDMQIDLKTFLSDNEKIILDLAPVSGACKGRGLTFNEHPYSRVNFEIRLFATEHCDIDLFKKLIHRVERRAKLLIKKVAHVTGSIKVYSSNQPDRIL